MRPVGAESFHADGQMDMKLTVAFRNFANAPKKKPKKRIENKVISKACRK